MVLYVLNFIQVHAAMQSAVWQFFQLKGERRRGARQRAGVGGRDAGHKKENASKHTCIMSQL